MTVTRTRRMKKGVETERVMANCALDSRGDGYNVSITSHCDAGHQSNTRDFHCACVFVVQRVWQGPKGVFKDAGNEAFKKTLILCHSIHCPHPVF